MRFERDDLGIERRDLATLGFKAHGADHVGPLHQARRIGNRQTAETGHARRAVDQTQAIFGTQLNRLQTFFGQGLLGGNDLPAITDIADTQQRDADVRHVGQVTDRTLGRHLRDDAAIEQRQEGFDHPAMNAGFAMAVIQDRCAENCTGLLVGQRSADATSVAEQGVARQLAQLFVFERDVAQRTQARVDAIRSLATGDDALNDRLGILDPRPGLGRQLKLSAMTGDGNHILPTQRGVGDNDFFSLGHL